VCFLLLCAAQVQDYVEVGVKVALLCQTQPNLYPCRQAGSVLPVHWAPKPGCGSSAVLCRSWMMTMMLQQVQSWLSWLASVPAPWQHASRHSRRKTVRRHAHTGAATQQQVALGAHSMPGRAASLSGSWFQCARGTSSAQHQCLAPDVTTSAAVLCYV
jgi:hypothetical protein